MDCAVKITREQIRRMILEEMAKKGGSYPDETYGPTKLSDLMLDRPTTHGGWPDGPSKSFTSDEPVNKQISNWLKSMGMLESE